MFNWLSKHFFCYPIAESYWLVAAIAVALLVIVVLVGPGRTRVSFKRRLTLALLRCGDHPAARCSACCGRRWSTPKPTRKKPRSCS